MQNESRYSSIIGPSPSVHRFSTLAALRSNTHFDGDYDTGVDQYSQFAEITNRANKVRSELGPLNYSDFDCEGSERMLREANLVSISRLVTTVDDEDGNPGAYTGQWAATNVGRSNNGSLMVDRTSEVRHGRGTFIWSDGAIYEGYWLHDKPNGIGRKIFADGRVYTGQWSDSVREG